MEDDWEFLKKALAEQIDYIPLNIKDEFNKKYRLNFNEKRSKDFYEGLLMGFAKSYNLLMTEGNRKTTDYLGVITALIADKLKDLD